jgi:hypothetical protein
MTPHWPVPATPTRRDDDLDWPSTQVAPHLLVDRRCGASGSGGPAFPSAAAPLEDEQAVYQEPDRAGRESAGVDGIVAREGVDLKPVVRDLGMEDLSRCGKAARLDNGGVTTDVDPVVAARGVDDLQMIGFELQNRRKVLVGQLPAG